MSKVKTTLVLAALALSTNIGPALAQKAATSTTVKIGYFNLGLVKASYTEAGESDSLKNQAEAQLRKDLDDANKNIQQMQTAKKSAEEIQKAVRESQVALAAKQQALAQLVQGQMQATRQHIQNAVAQVAKDKGLDLVIDGEGLFAGGQTVLSNGVDITEDVVKKLGPQVQKSAAK